MHISLVAAFPFLVTLLVGSVNAQGGQTCNATTLCGAAAPCCSQYGFCGTDSFCLGGCNPLASNTLTSCMPEPVCQNAVYTFADDSRILSNATYYNGNVSQYDWVVEKGNIFNTNSSGGELALILTESNGGTLLASTRYVHYGTITATLKTGRWAGVVTAFITMSDIKDEIDWEFPGTNTTAGQTNYFWQGYVPSPTKGGVSLVSNDTFANYHDYTIDWQPTSMTFSIDGKVVRTINQADTIDPAGVSRFPSTPSRIEFSIWPAGIPSEPIGVQQWAGGAINWADPDYVSAGHFYALLKQVTVRCADPQAPGPNITGYLLGKNSSQETPGVLFTNATTLLNGAPGAFGGEAIRFHSMITVVALGLVLSFFV